MEHIVTFSGKTREAQRLLWESAQRSRRRNDVKQKRATRMLPIEVRSVRNALSIFSVHTDAVLNEHVVVMEELRGGSLAVINRVEFNTTEWVLFCRGLGPSGTPISPFVIPQHPVREYYFRYNIVFRWRLGGRYVELSQRFISVGASALIRALEWEKDRKICVPYDMWVEMRDVIRRGCLVGT